MADKKTLSQDQFNKTKDKGPGIKMIEAPTEESRYYQL